MNAFVRLLRRPLRPAPVLALLLLTTLAGRLEAQKGGRQLSVTGSQALAFGTLFPGVVVSVPRTDALRAGQFQITGTKSATVQVTFTLPSALTFGGQSVPLTFGTDDGGFASQNNIGAATGFNPAVPLTTALSAQGRLYLFLGGTATPSTQQAAGGYNATISVTVCYVGLTC